MIFLLFSPRFSFFFFFNIFFFKFMDGLLLIYEKLSILELDLLQGYVSVFSYTHTHILVAKENKGKENTYIYIYIYIRISK